MATLLYTPGVRLLIETAKSGIIDVSDHLEQGTVSLHCRGQPSEMNVSIINHRRMYDGVFTPNDRFSLQLKRITWLQVMSGYLTRVPYYSVYPRTIQLKAHCTMKRLQYTLWDEGAPESFALLQQVMGSSESAKLSDGGMDNVLTKLLTEVAGWPAEAIHIGMVPPKWMDSVADLYEKLSDHLQVSEALIGTGTTFGGVNPITGGTTTMPGNGPGTGVLPGTGGISTWFGGPNGGAYGSMELTGEPGASPRDPWYCAMRWPYKVLSAPGKVTLAPGITSADATRARQWWLNQRILVVNPANNRAVVLRPADWGPHTQGDGRIIDMSQHALENVLGIPGKGQVQVRFAQPGTPLGPASTSAAAPSASAPVGGGTPTGAPAVGYGDTLSANPEGAPQNWTIPAGANPQAGDMNWHGFANGQIPADKLKAVPGFSGTILMPQAADAMAAMIAAAKRDGVVLKPGGGYRSYEAQVATKAAKGSLAATPGTSNHGHAVAVDFDSGIFNPGSWTSKAYTWLRANSAKFGWTHPGWAQQGGSKPEIWHWEFWAALNYVPGGAGGGTAAPGTGGPFNVWQWVPRPDPESSVLAGPRALMNDRPILEAIQRFAGAAQRTFMAAPNGDFIAWFPDYFGQYGMLGKMVIQDIEIEMPGFSIDWDDTYLITHQFVAGAPSGLNIPPQAVDIHQKFLTAGIASVEFPEIMQALFNVNPTDPNSAGFASSEAILQRFGARMDFRAMGNITGHEPEFWFAVHLFQENWAAQFHSEIHLTFMPELYPGMHIQLPTFKFQAYVEGVTHRFDFREGSSGFTTDVDIMAPSSIEGGGLYGLPRGGPR